MANKMFDLAVKVGQYTDNTGQTKNRYQNVGVVLDGPHGPYMLLNRYFNPAGVPCDTSKDSIVVSMFNPRGQASEPSFGSSDDEGEVVF